MLGAVYPAQEARFRGRGCAVSAVAQLLVSSTVAEYGQGTGFGSAGAKEFDKIRQLHDAMCHPGKTRGADPIYVDP